MPVIHGNEKAGNGREDTGEKGQGWGPAARRLQPRTFPARHERGGGGCGVTETAHEANHQRRIRRRLYKNGGGGEGEAGMGQAAFGATRGREQTPMPDRPPPP